MKYKIIIICKRWLKLFSSYSLIILFALSTFHSIAQSQMVLVEEVTQASCGACAAQNPAFDALLQANSDKVTVLKYHAALPGYDRMNLDNPTEVQDRLNYYGFVGVPPVAFINGTYVANDCQAYEGAPACLDQLDINTAYNTSPVFDLEVSASYANNTLNVSGTLTANDAVDGDLKLRLALAEQVIQYSDAPGGTSGEIQYHHVFKKFITGTVGTNLDDSWASGDSYTFNESTDLTGMVIYDYTALEIIAFVQDDSDGNVLQAAKDTDIPLTVSFTNNAVAFGIKALPEELCAGEQTIAPVFTLQNGGNEVLTSVDIVYEVNGGQMQSLAWTGTLEVLAREDIVLPAYTFTATNSNTVSVSIQNPNGTADEDMTDNNLAVDIVPAVGTINNTITLELTTDTYPLETTWQMRSASGIVFYSGGPYSESETYTVEMLLPQDDCYEFEIFDEIGDGICCGFGQGVYQLTDGDGNVLAQGGQFTTGETTLLMLTGGTNINNNASITAHEGLTDIFCGEVSFAPSVTVQNLGINGLTSIDIEVRNSGSLIAMETWTGGLISGEEVEIQLAEITLQGDADLSFHIVGVNGEEDIHTDGNEYLSPTVPTATTGYAELTMALNTDCWPEETTWAIEDEDGEVVVSGGPYAGQAETAIYESFVLTDGCYEFVYRDVYGDGLGGSQWTGCYVDGNIALFDAIGTVLFEYDGSFDTPEERSLFNYGMSVGIEETIFGEGFTLSPNPTVGNLTLDFTLEKGADATISVHNMLGAEIMTRHLGTLTSGSHTQHIEMNDLANGVYIVRLNAGSNSIVQKVLLAK